MKFWNHVTVKLLGMLLLLVELGGCTALGDDPAPPDARAVAELRMHGITFSPDSGSFPSLPNSPVCSTDNEYINGAQHLGFFLSPDPQLSRRAELVPFFGGDLRIPYDFFFSVAEGDSFIQIDRHEGSAGEYISSLDSYEDLDVYFGIVRPESGIGEFIFYGDFYLRELHLTYPARATHIELWLRNTADSERQLVHRVALDDLYGWRTYIQPSLQTDDNGIVRCVSIE